MTGVDPAVEALATLILGASWPDGGRDGFPTCRTAAMIAEHLVEHGVTLARPRCDTCGGTGVVPEGHDGGTHPIHCPEGCDLPVTLAADREPDGLRAAVEALRMQVNDEALTHWYHHNEASDDGDLDRANSEGAIAVVFVQTSAALARILAAHPATDQPEVDRG